VTSVPERVLRSLRLYLPEMTRTKGHLKFQN
jgi:hypothetical protein